MILYQLACANGHQFEAWFRDGATYDAQSAAGVVYCPLCGCSGVTKAPMAPNVATGKTGGKDSAPAEAVAEKITRAMDELRRHVEGNCDYVGEQFAEEARRIHYGEADERNIYGEATDREASELDDEGIDYWRLPPLPRRNS